MLGIDDNALREGPAQLLAHKDRLCTRWYLF